MADSLGKVLAACALGMLVGMPVAQAADGRITFSGAVVESTCSTESVSMAMSPGVDVDAAHRLGCNRTATSAGSSYSRVVTSLATAELSHDRLLDYFGTYARVAGSDEFSAKVLVQTYD
jgi:hypothetical protein